MRVSTDASRSVRVSREKEQGSLAGGVQDLGSRISAGHLEANGDSVGRGIVRILIVNLARIVHPTCGNVPAAIPGCPATPDHPRRHATPPHAHAILRPSRGLVFHIKTRIHESETRWQHELRLPVSNRAPHANIRAHAGHGAHERCGSKENRQRAGWGRHPGASVATEDRPRICREGGLRSSTAHASAATSAYNVAGHPSSLRTAAAARGLARGMSSAATSSASEASDRAPASATSSRSSSPCTRWGASAGGREAQESPTEASTSPENSGECAIATSCVRGVPRWVRR